MLTIQALNSSEHFGIRSALPAKGDEGVTFQCLVKGLHARCECMHVGTTSCWSCAVTTALEVASDIVSLVGKEHHGYRNLNMI